MPEWLQYTLIPFIGVVIVTTAITFVAGKYSVVSEYDENEQKRQVRIDSQKDSKEFGYDDECYGSKKCRKCKSGINCLGCMQNCYNRFADYQDPDNKFQRKAQLCVRNCWNNDEGDRQIRTDFDIPSMRDKKKK